jgi:hypothetical protein
MQVSRISQAIAAFIASAAVIAADNDNASSAKTAGLKTPVVADRPSLAADPPARAVS